MFALLSTRAHQQCDDVERLIQTVRGWIERVDRVVEEVVLGPEATQPDGGAQSPGVETLEPVLFQASPEGRFLSESNGVDCRLNRPLLLFITRLFREHGLLLLLFRLVGFGLLLRRLLVDGFRGFIAHNRSAFRLWVILLAE
jgi:hypothetical protein